MQRLEVSGAVRPIYVSLGVKRLMSDTDQMNDASGVWTARQIRVVAGFSPRESRLRYRFSPLVFRYGQIGSGTGFGTSNFVLPCQ